MTKFNVGDKVRVTNVKGILFGDKYFVNGGIYEVMSVSGANHINLGGKNSKGAARHSGLVITSDEYHAIELVGETSTDRRLTEAEAKIAALEAEVETMKCQIYSLEKNKADTPESSAATVFSQVHRKKTPNQRRADVIKRAQAFVADLEKRAGTRFDDNYDGNGLFNRHTTELSFHVNSEKGVVTALAYGSYGKRLFAKAFAKCAPGDVFNADIGKAVAAGRLYGVKVPKEFTDAVKPTEVVVGMVVAGSEKDGFYSPTKRYKLTDPGRYRGSFHYDGSSDWIFSGQIGAIIDDSDAVYL